MTGIRFAAADGQRGAIQVDIHPAKVLDLDPSTTGGYGEHRGEEGRLPFRL